MKKKQQIFSPDWISLHPYENSANTDYYYIKLANRVYDVIEDTLTSIKDEYYLIMTDRDKKALSCILTAYFEDIISESNMWTTFVELTKNKYNRYLPFFDTEDYAEGEINTDDLKFLCWHFFTQINESQIAIAPTEKLFSKIAERVYEIFDEEYETAPVNEKLRSFFELSDDANLFEAQSKFFWLGTESYLFYFNSRDLEKELNEVSVVAEEQGMQEQLAEMVNMVLTDFSFNNTTELHKLTAPQWLGHIIGEEHELYEPLVNMSLKKSGYFIFQEQDSMYAQFKHVASEEIIQVTNRSLSGYPKDLKSPEVVIYAGFVEWQGEWWFVGDLRGYDVDEELIAEIKSRPEEQSLFAEANEEVIHDAAIAQYIDNTLTTLREEHPEEDELDLYWSLLFDPEIPTQYLKTNILRNNLGQLSFPGEGNEQLLKANIDFVMDYFRRI